jgi:acyl carrier protein
MAEVLTETDIRRRLRTFIVENFLYTRQDFAFTDDDSLLRRGIFDSLGVTEVISFVEQTWDLSVPEQDVTDVNFGTVSGMSRYVTRQRFDQG